MKIKDMITQDAFAWYLPTSQHYFSKKWIGAANENLHFDLVQNIMERRDNSVKGSVGLELGSLVRDK